ncbi:hypothetical protein EDC01DRAFT_660498 [Geopyxis carbonaria]|nr:hypothetical protein EDC01DRAFT_660498 [Geopyxis carbonaria]
MYSTLHICLMCIDGAATAPTGPTRQRLGRRGYKLFIHIRATKCTYYRGCSCWHSVLHKRYSSGAHISHGVHSGKPQAYIHRQGPKSLVKGMLTICYLVHTRGRGCCDLTSSPYLVTSACQSSELYYICVYLQGLHQQPPTAHVN